MFLFLGLVYFHQTFLNQMEIFNKLKRFKQFKDDRNCDSLWTLNDNCSQGSLSTTSLSIDVDEFKYMDDDSESSSSDEIYSLETSLIEMNNQDDSNSVEEKTTYNQNWIYHHQATPIINRSKNYYDNDNFTDDTLSQLANKGFAQSLSKQNFVQKHIFHKEEPNLDSILTQLKEKQLVKPSNGSFIDSPTLCKRIINTDNLMERSFDMDLLDNDDLLSISSHGSDRSATPVDKSPGVQNESQAAPIDSDSTVPSNSINSRSRFGDKTIHFIKPKLLKFTDGEDIDSLSPNDTSGTYNHDDGDEIEAAAVDIDDEDNLTICGDYWKDYQEIESYKETLYHQPPKSADRSAAQRLARRLFDLDGFKLSDVSKHLSKRNDFNQLVGEEFANFFDFMTMSLDTALRKFLEKFILCGDTQERERVIHHFSRRYLQCNPNAYNSEEACHTLVCAVMLLNTDLHGNTINRKMTCDDFVVSMAELNNGDNFSNEELIQLFNSILNNSIRWNLDNELIGLIQPKIDYIDFNKQINTNNLNFYQEVPSEATSKEYMSGYLLRKCIKESHFRRTSIGKRGWKLYFGRLQDLTLYLYKDEISLNGSLRRSSKKLTKEKELCRNGNSYSDPVLDQIVSTNDDPKDKKVNGRKPRRSLRLPRLGRQKVVQSSSPSSSNREQDRKSSSDKDSIPSSSDLDSFGTLQLYLNHSFSSKATDYSKKRNVFRLQVSSGSEYLFQVNEPREVDLWVDCLNFVAALLSPPVLCNGSSKDISDCLSKKSNPTLTTLNIKEQLESHQRCVLTLDQDLMQLNSKPPLKSDKTKLKWQYNRQRKFIERELIRYKTYSRLLEYELIHLHNLSMTRLSQQSFIDPYLIPVQYSQMAGSSPLFYNQQTNQFIPINCVQGNMPVFQYQLGYGGVPLGNVNNNSSSIKELSEESSSQLAVAPQEPLNASVQPVIIRSSIPCNRSTRSQLTMNKRRRYRNQSLQQPSLLTSQVQPQQHQQLMIQYNVANPIPSIKKPLYTPNVAACDANMISPPLFSEPTSYIVEDNQENSGKPTLVHSLPNIPQINGTNPPIENSFYEVL